MNRFYGAAAIFVALIAGSTGISAQFRQSAGTSIQDAVKNSASDAHQPSDPSAPEVLNDIGKFEIRPYVSRIHESVNYNWRRLIRESGRNYSERSGRTIVEFVVDRDGTLRKLEVVNSSDQEDLDKLATDSLALSAPFPALPKGLSSKDLHLRFTFKFIPAKKSLWKRR